MLQQAAAEAVAQHQQQLQQVATVAQFQQHRRTAATGLWKQHPTVHCLERGLCVAAVMFGAFLRLNSTVIPVPAAFTSSGWQLVHRPMHQGVVIRCMHLLCLPYAGVGGLSLGAGW